MHGPPRRARADRNSNLHSTRTAELFLFEAPLAPSQTAASRTAKVAANFLTSSHRRQLSFFSFPPHHPTTKPASPTPSRPPCLVAVPPSMSLALAMALGPAISPTNSNGNFDPSFLQLLPSENHHHLSSIQHRPRPRSSPTASSFSRRSYSAVYNLLVVSCPPNPPTVVPCLPPCLSSSSLRSSGRPMSKERKT